MANLIPHLVIWAVLTTVVIFLALYRRKIDLKADDMLHFVDSEQAIVGQQQVVAKKLESIDRWGKILTALVALYGAALVAWYLYSLFSDTTVKID